jgi:uncharacterized protein involved in exopolysaccharide biosynthesis
MQEKQFENEEFSSFKMMSILFKRKWLIIIMVTLTTTASVFISLNMKVWYKSTVNVVPPKGDDGGISGSIGSALKEFGLGSLGGGSGGESYDYLVILQSRTVVDSLINKYDLATVYDIPIETYSDVRKAFWGNFEISYEKTGNYTVSIWDEDPQRAADMANDIIKIANRHSVRIAHEEARLNTEHLESRYKAIDGRLRLAQDSVKKFSKEFMVIAPEEQAKSMTEALAELKTSEIQYEFMYNTSVIKLGEDDARTKEIKSIWEQTTKKIDNIQNEPGFAGNFAVNDAASVGLEYVNFLADIEALTQMKAILLPMIEEAKYDEVKKIENLYVVDEAIPADKKDKPKRSLIVIGAFVGSTVLMIFLVLLTNAIQEFMAQYRKQYKKYK